MNERFHIIVTGENGRSSSFQISKRSLFTSLTTVIIGLIAICVFGYFTTGSHINNSLLSRKVDDLQGRLTESKRIAKAYQQEIAALKSEHRDALAALTQEQETELATLKMVYDLENTNLQLENLRLMNTAVSDLNQRSELIETVMDTIGVKIEANGAAADGSGGPYIPAEKASYDDLLKKVDDYLATIRMMPLGRPVSGAISSPFGNRIDPFNGQKAFHEGVDIRADRGEKVYATACGVITQAFKNGNYGNYVEIDHGNGYTTAYAHLQSFLVKPGESVEQGQIIGQVGNTGRSTGAHLHYEIRLNDRPINPAKYLKVADIAYPITAKRE